MQKTVTLIASTFLCATVASQTGRPPTKVGTALDLPTFGPSSSAGSIFANSSPAINEIKQFEFRRFAAGRFQLTMTVRVANGSADEIITGTVDTTVNPWTWTQDTSVLQNLTTTGGFAGTMTPDRLVFAFDSGTGNNVQYSVRSSTTVPFPPSKPLGITGFVDSKLFTRDGKDYFAYAGGQDLRAIEIDRTRFAAGTDPRVGNSFVVLPFPGFVMHSQEPLLDNNGNARAWIHSTNNGGTSGGRARPWFNPIVRVNADNTKVSDQFQVGPNDDTWLANPGALGSTTLYAQAPPSSAYGDPKQIRLVINSGDAVPAATGGTLRLSAWLPYQDANNWAVTLLLGAPMMDVTIPGFRGKLAVGPQFFALAPQLWTGNDIAKDWTVPVPAGLSPGVLWAQTLAYDPSGSVQGDTWYFGNTAPLEIF